MNKEQHALLVYLRHQIDEDQHTVTSFAHEFYQAGDKVSNVIDVLKGAK